MEKPPMPIARDRIAAQALAAFGQYLRSNSPYVSELEEMADLVYKVSLDAPSLKPRALFLLSEITRRLISLRPSEASYRFAYALSLLSSLKADSLWPDDLRHMRKEEQRRLFLEALRESGEGLELLSFGPSSPSLSLDMPSSLEPTPYLTPSPPRLDFLSPEGGMALKISKASQPEKLALAWGAFSARFLSVLSPESLPPWHKLQTASFLRRSAATGYLPPEERMAFFRLSVICLNSALENLELRPEDLALSPFILSEKGLAYAELSVLVPSEKNDLLKKANAFWEEAEKQRKGSSFYSKARWAAFEGDEKALKELLVHASEDEDLFLWPPYSIALLEPAFREYKDRPWFKRMWFGYYR
jgi:hypothetical protein